MTVHGSKTLAFCVKMPYLHLNAFSVVLHDASYCLFEISSMVKSYTETVELVEMAGHWHLQCERRVGCSSIIEAARNAIWRVSKNRVYIDMRISGNKRRECRWITRNN